MTVLAVAHRAGNTTAGLQAALALGVDVVEADVHQFRGRSELRHSKALRPLPLLYDEGRVTVRRPVRLLHELLDDVGDASTLMLDLKGPGQVGRRVALALRAAPPARPVLVCSRWWSSVEACAGVEHVRTVLTARTPGEVGRLRRRVRSGRAPYGISLHRSLLDAELVSCLRRRVALVMTWPVNDTDALTDVLAIGVNGVISDDAEVLRLVVTRRPDHRAEALPPGPHLRRSPSTEQELP